MTRVRFLVKLLRGLGNLVVNGEVFIDGEAGFQLGKVQSGLEPTGHRCGAETY